MDPAIISLLTLTLRAGTSLILATLGGILTERAGVMCLLIEGVMLASATIGFAADHWSGLACVGLVAAVLTGAGLAAVHALLSLFFRRNQVVSGLAISIFGTGLASFLGQRLGPNGSALVGLNGPRFERLAIPGVSNVGLGSLFFSHDFLTYTTVVLVGIVWWFLFRTVRGLNLRACGENPKAASALGVGVLKTQYLATIIGGALIGMAGAHLSLAYSPGWTENLTGGRGWIAVALVVFSGWHPIRAAGGALLFGAISALQFRLQTSNVSIPPAMLGMLPYAATLIVLIAVSLGKKRFRSPAALGQPFWQE